MGEGKNKEPGKDKMDQWVKDHEDSLDYPDVPVGKGYQVDDSEYSPEVQVVMAKRMEQLAKENAVKYYIFDDNSPLIARQEGNEFPEIYLKGGWQIYRDVECFSLNIKEISEEEAVRAIAELSQQ